jgi:CDP-paratose 2-epimerase
MLRILITGVCGFVGRWLAQCLKDQIQEVKVVGLDNLSRPGSEQNRAKIMEMGIDFFHADLRCSSDMDTIPPVDWIIDCAAQTSVMAGVDGQTSSRQLIEHNLIGTLNLLEVCKRQRCGLIMLSTSRVYSVLELAKLPIRPVNDAFQLETATGQLPASVSEQGIDESFSTQSPSSLYGSTKLASERMAQEYSFAFQLPLRINRCGLMAGAGQFGRSDQGIFSYWINAHRQRQRLNYIGFGGQGWQVRDCLHPKDLAQLIRLQLHAGDDTTKPVVANVSGGIASARSLLQLTQWCDRRFGVHSVGIDASDRPYDLPWVVLNSSLAETSWAWKPETTVEQIFDEIARAI